MKNAYIVLRVLALTLALLLIGACAAEGAEKSELTEGAEIRVMSYNILHPEWGRVPVAGRDERVNAIIRRYMPDVVALQEAGAGWHKALKPLLTEPGPYAFACRQSHAAGFTYCTTTFLYNTDTLRLVEDYILDLEWNHATRVVAVAVFERVADGARFVAANTHPAPQDDAAKYARNMADIVKYTGELMQNYPGLPLILCGDFNTPEQSEVYTDFMHKTGLGDAKYLAETQLLNCSTYFGYGAEPDAMDTEMCIDHIFVNEQIEVKLYDAVMDDEVQNASDHIPIYADVRFK